MKKLTIGILLAVSTIALGSGFFGGGGAGGGSWGSITGTLSAQTDLQSALDAKISDPGTVTDNAMVRWDGTGGATVQDSGVTVSDLATGYFSLRTANDATADANPPNGITVLPGNKTAGTGNGGEIQIGGGTSSGGQRGAVRFLGNSTSGNRLCIATETDNVGFLGYSYPDGGYRRIASAWFGSGLKVGASTSTEIGVELGKGSNGGYIAFTRNSANTGMSIQTEYNKSMQIYPPSAVDSNPVFGFGDWGDSTKYGRFMLMKSTEADVVWYTEGAGSIGLASGSRPLHIRQTGYRASTSKTVDLTADDQAVTVNDKSYIKLTSDNATSTNRTAVLGDGGMEGQVLVLQWGEDAGTGAGEIADGSNTQLSAAWTPDINDTLSLIWDGTDWIETARANN